MDSSDTGSEDMKKGSHHTIESKILMRIYNDGLNDLPVSRNRLWQIRHPDRYRKLAVAQWKSNQWDFLNTLN
jgi:hypothetical protein